jgi:D-aminoacyl-tRNA deacylase
VRLVIQRVSQARVSVNGKAIGEIAAGLCIFVGVGQSDAESQAQALAQKVVHLRIFADENGQMNRSLLDVGGAILLISQFTLYADCRRGHRPSFSKAASAEQAEAVYLQLANCFRAAGVTVATGIFKAHMRVELTNDGPVTLTLEN